jgi:hypothetical protein
VIFVASKRGFVVPAPGFVANQFPLNGGHGPITPVNYRRDPVERKLLAINVLCVLAATLLAHVATSEPPAPDRVGFPKDYRTQYKVLGVKLRDEAPEVLTAYGNEQAASVASRAQLPFPEGSVILMEFSYALRDANNQIQRDANGVVQKGAVEHVDVMKRGKGFGEMYGENRSGEWEYAGYKLDGSYVTSPAASTHCAGCHRKAGPENDFVYRMRPPAPAGKM